MTPTFRALLKQFIESRGGWVLYAAIVSIIVRLVSWPLVWLDAIWAVCIVASWPWLEWFAHRFLMHEWRFTGFRFTHDRHHANPTTDTGLPDRWIIAMYWINTFVFPWFDMPRLYTIHTVVLCMLTLYEFSHFSCHCNYQPRTWWGWAVRINHLQHHKLESRDRYALLFPFFRK